MNALTLIRNNPSLTLDQLNEKNITYQDHTLIGPVGLRKRLPPEVVEGAALMFEGAAQQFATMRMLKETFTTYGFDFSDPDTLASIDALVAGAGGGPEVVAIGEALKSLSIRQISIVEQALGLDTTLSQQEYDSAHAILTQEAEQEAKATLISTVAAQYNAVYTLLQAGQTTQAKAVWEQGAALFD